MIRGGYAALPSNNMNEPIRANHIELTVSALAPNGLIYFRAKQSDEVCLISSKPH